MMTTPRSVSGNWKILFFISLILPILVIIKIIDLELQFRGNVELGIFQLEMIYLSFMPPIYSWRKMRQKVGRRFQWIDIYWIPFAAILIFYVTAIPLAMWFAT